MICKKCGESLVSLAVKALLVDCVAKVYPSPLECVNGEHEFVEEGGNDDQGD